jgi:hypothetical protein
MAGLVRATLALIVIWLLGALLLAALGLRRRRWPLACSQPGIDFAVGAALLATLWPCAALLGWQVRPWSVLALAAALALPAALRWRGPPEPAEKEHLPPSSPRTAWLGWVVVALLVVCCAAALFRAYTSPMFWDGRYIWGFKAKAMFEDGRLDRETFTNLARYRPTHIDYPLAVPAAEAWMYQCMGGVDERRAQFVGVVYWLGLITLLAGYLRRRMAFPWALGLALLVCQIPVMAYHAAGGGADVPQAFYLLAAGLLLADWAECGRREDFLLAALLFGAGALIKPEGLSLALGGVLLLGLGWWLRRPGVRGRDLACGLALLALPYLPWAVLRAYWAIPSLQLTAIYGRPLAENLDRLAIVLRFALGRVFLVSGWELAWPLVGLGLLSYLLWLRRVPALGLMWAVLAWQFLVYVAVYVLSPYNVAEHLSTSYDRVLLHLMPLAVAAAVTSLASLGRQNDLPPPLDAPPRQ